MITISNCYWQGCSRCYFHCVWHALSNVEKHDFYAYFAPASISHATLLTIIFPSRVRFSIVKKRSFVYFSHAFVFLFIFYSFSLCVLLLFNEKCQCYTLEKITSSWSWFKDSMWVNCEYYARGGNFWVCKTKHLR